jgi:hypothetical protein
VRRLELWVSVSYFSTFDIWAGFSFTGKWKWAATKTAHLFGDFLSPYYVVQRSETIIRICVSKKLQVVDLFRKKFGLPARLWFAR